MRDVDSSVSQSDVTRSVMHESISEELNEQCVDFPDPQDFEQEKDVEVVAVVTRNENLGGCTSGGSTWFHQMSSKRNSFSVSSQERLCKNICPFHNSSTL